MRAEHDRECVRTTERGRAVARWVSCSPPLSSLLTGDSGQGEIEGAEGEGKGEREGGESERGKE